MRQFELVRQFHIGGARCVLIGCLLSNCAHNGSDACFGSLAQSGSLIPYSVENILFHAISECHCTNVRTAHRLHDISIIYGEIFINKFPTSTPNTNLDFILLLFAFYYPSLH